MKNHVWCKMGVANSGSEEGNRERRNLVEWRGRRKERRNDVGSRRRGSSAWTHQEGWQDLSFAIGSDFSNED